MQPSISEPRKALAMNRKPQLPWRPGQKEAWRIERLIRHAPPHHGETGPSRLLLSVAAVGVLGFLLALGSLLWPREPSLSDPGVTAPPAVATRTPVRVISSTSVRPSSPLPTASPVRPSPPIPTATVPRPSSTVPPTPAARKYKIQPGDTLLALANRFHVTIEAIQAANGMTDTFLRAGEELIIPLPTRAP
jgi:LysM repeat protein